MQAVQASTMTSKQQDAFRRLLLAGGVQVYEPCDCGGQVRHNNGGNYHAEWYYRLDCGTVYRHRSWSGDYPPPEKWVPILFSEAIQEIADKIAEGWRSCDYTHR